MWTAAQEGKTVIEIRHRESGEVLHRVEADTLEGLALAGLKLAGATCRV